MDDLKDRCLTKEKNSMSINIMPNHKNKPVALVGLEQVAFGHWTPLSQHSGGSVSFRIPFFNVQLSERILVLQHCLNLS